MTRAKVQQVDNWWVRIESRIGMIDIGKDRLHFPYGLKDVYPRDFEYLIKMLTIAIEEQKNWAKLPSEQD